MIAQALPDDTVVIDCGADFRLTDASAWDTFYGGEYAGSWPYGLPELAGQRPCSPQSTRIAVPGCYPTVSTLALAPAVAAGIVDASGIVVVAASGTSGAGKAPKTNLLGSEVMGSASAYGVGGTHRHTPEITQNLRLLTDDDVRVSFTPLLVPMPRGILATCSAPTTVSADEAYATYQKAYADEPFVHLLPQGQWPADQVRGRLQRRARAGHRRRGGRPAGRRRRGRQPRQGHRRAAVQCMNLALGLPETTGLTTIGLAP